MGGEVKPAKGLRRHLNSGFVAGFLLVLVTYVIVSQQFAMDTPTAVTSTAPRIDEKESMSKAPVETDDKVRQEWQPKETPKDTSSAVATEELPKIDSTNAKPIENGKVVCSSNGFYSDTCDVDGDVRINGTALSVTLVPASRSSERREWKIQPYPRRTVSGIQEVTVTQLATPGAAAPACTVSHGVPAVVFALGGLTGNYWHDFSDVLVPLFVASRQYGGEVQFLVSNIQPWWLGKYEAIVRRLSRYDAVDLDRDGEVRCFRHVTVGLRMHKEFSVRPELAPGGLTMADFTAFLRDAYALPRAAAAIGVTQSPPQKRPRLVVIRRGHYRKLVNMDEVVRAAEAAGFETAVMAPRFDERVEDVAREVNTFDAMVGVHGAGLTNAAFLPAGAVVIQVVPYGRLERMAKADFGEPVADMGLRYVEYSVAAEESTLLEMLGPEHEVLKDPAAVHRSGWDMVAEYYLGKQDVRINVTRFAPILAQAFHHLRHS
ncbi:beta-1,2-xylosyltransferase XYXT1-like [Oryza brachyantha]|uniref:beta-1,2-xylosyltransferase XYXT1-like n=1 Tax=Oryza brachyantha TaxID=4533 RepID=UPI001AD9B2FE|nr:beta-1,2-xylosyltransferase XYXT1-like [Oryza brachyantha]